jgi:ubiquinone/menaquinone biosynthesis C-methylase UbiE
MRFFRKSPVPDLPTAMSGVKLGDRLLVLGCSNANVIASLAAKVGLTGRACAMDAAADRAAAAAAVAEREGVLIETATAPFNAIPYEPASFDLAVVQDLFGSIAPALRSGMLQEVHRVLRPGGRCLIMQTAGRRGIASLFGGGTLQEDEHDTAAAAVRALEMAGFVAVRKLAEQAGQVFVEGIKKS